MRVFKTITLQEPAPVGRKRALAISGKNKFAENLQSSGRAVPFILITILLALANCTRKEEIPEVEPISPCQPSNEIEAESFIQMLKNSSSQDLSYFFNKFSNRESWKCVPYDLKRRFVGALIEALGHESSKIRNGSAKILGVLAEEDISTALRIKMIDPLIEALGDDDFGVQASAAESLAKIAGSNIPDEEKNKIVDRVIRKLESGNWEVREGAANYAAALAESNIPAELKAKMLDPLIERLKDRRWEVRQPASKALLKLAESEIPERTKRRMINPLMQALGDKDSTVGENAAKALARLAESNIPAELKDRIVERVVRKALRVTSWEVEGWHGATDAIIALSEANIPIELKTKIVGLLADALRSRNVQVRFNAASALDDLAKSNASTELKARMVDPLIGALVDRDPGVREWTTYALATISELDISIELKFKIAISLVKALDANESMSQVRKKQQTILSELGQKFFRDRDYEKAATALSSSGFNELFLRTLAQISVALTQTPNEYQIFEVTLSNGLKVRSFKKIDGSEADTHVFYDDTTIGTAITGEVKLLWTDDRNIQREMSLGVTSQNIIHGQINLQALYPGTFGVVTFESIATSETLNMNNILWELRRRALDPDYKPDEKLPCQIFVGLNTTFIHPPWGGSYSSSAEHINLGANVDIHVVIHELIHHWDMTVTQEKPEIDLSRIYRGISWNDQGQRLEGDLSDFQDAYGMTYSIEDITTFGAAFYTDGNGLRMRVRGQMSQGNFEPAAKYLFVKHFIFHGSEYGLSARSPSLPYSEIKEAMSRNGQNIRIGTLRAINEIQRLTGIDK